MKIGSKLRKPAHARSGLVVLPLLASFIVLLLAPLLRSQRAVLEPGLSWRP